MCELLVGLPDLNVDGVCEWPPWLRIEITRRARRATCPGCGGGVHDHGRRETWCWSICRCSDARLGWCGSSSGCVANPTRSVATWSEVDERIAPSRAAITDRAGRWATFEVGRHDRSVAEVATDLACDWHTIMDAVIDFGEQLVDDPNQIGDATAPGLDEILFCRQGLWLTQCWSTQIVDVTRGQLLDLVAGRNAAEPRRWLAARADEWRAKIRWATLDLSGPYRSVFDTMLPHAVQVTLFGSPIRSMS